MTFFSYILFITILVTVNSKKTYFTLQNCTKVVTQTKPQYVPYTEYFRERSLIMFQPFRWKSRTNYRIEYHEVTHFEPTCCDGYESLGFTLCSPICEKPCTDGSCSAPNTCSCDDGYALSQTDKSLCEPICHRPCVNGTCTAPDTCTCDRGYEFRYLSKFTCVPICTDCFIFEYCAEPGVCRCLQKYSRQTSLDRADTNVNFEKCKPVCQENCVNSKCIAPDLCECLPGYDISEDNPYACIPHCSTDCFNGKCTSPEICSCNEGYTQSLNSSSTCAPVCNENCVMGKCIEPDVCSCFEGYSLKNNSKYICEPICKEPCTNGTCSGPDTCTYTIGRNESKKSVNDATCSKTCKIGDATCIGGDWNCTCEEGYSYNKESENCKPICSTTCYNGLCTAPNTCTCLEGYRPQTDESLKHFSTICPNLDRDCFQGYRLDPKKVFEFCEPYCHTTCTNGFCSAPNTCTCNDGYQLKNDTNYGQICIPVCNCLNGYCNDTASACTMCEAGYELMDGDNSTFCKPFCQNGCQYGTCTAPNNCSCYSNWSGPSCDEPLTCIVTNSTHVEEYHILDNGFIINENVLNSDQSWNEPKCNEQCIDEINNATQCMNRTQIDGQNLTVCFIKIDSQCNLLNTMADSGNLRSTKPVILASVTLSVVLVVAIISAIIALIIRKRRNDRAAMPMARAKLQQDFLIENDGVYL